MEMVPALELLGDYTAGQWGMVTTRQAHSLGVDDVTLHRLRAARLLETVRHGVHATTSSAASDARLEQAIWLSLRPGTPAWERPELDPDGGVISHRSAARLHGLGDLPNAKSELTVPRRRTMRDPDVLLRQGKLDSSDITLLDGLPVTTPLRTIRDLLDRHTDASHVATIIRQAVDAGQVAVDDLPNAIAPFARRYGVRAADGTGLLVHLLAQIGVTTDELTPAITWGDLADVTWKELRDRNVTWGQLANPTPALAKLLRRATRGEER
jgi:predicted transcriptional regulator of viral defense system